MGNGTTEQWVRDKLGEHGRAIGDLREFRSAQSEKDAAMNARLANIERVLWFIGTTAILTLIGVVANLSIGG